MSNLYTAYPSVPDVDHFVQHAIAEIVDTYNVGQSVRIKPKSLHKFGRVTAAAQDTATTVSTFGSGEANETFVTTNVIDGVVGASTSDEGKIVTVEGHTIDANGLLTFVVQNVTLLDQAKATLTTPLARASRAYIPKGTFASPSTANAGNIYIYASSGVTLSSGVPQTASSIKNVIVASQSSSEKAQTSFSNVDYGVITRIHGAASRASAASNVDFRFEVRELGGVWLPKFETTVRTGGTGEFEYQPRPFLIIPTNSDCRMQVIPSANSTNAIASFDALFALVG